MSDNAQFIERVAELYDATAVPTWDEGEGIRHPQRSIQKISQRHPCSTVKRSRASEVTEGDGAEKLEKIGKSEHRLHRMFCHINWSLRTGIETAKVGEM